jgi:hypothetical protein
MAGNKKNDKAKGKAKDDDKAESSGKGGGKQKAANSINVRHILVLI